jgi:photosystem II stability/assembly factor-like uncharacterized protein
VKRTSAVLLALVLASACSGGKAKPLSVSPTAVPTPTATAAPETPTPTPATSAPTASPDSQGPTGGPVPNGFAPSSVTFISTETGWALGNAACGKPLCTTVVRTRNGGRTWRSIPAPSAGEAGITQIRFVDLLHGYAFGNELFSTDDGGAHWTGQKTGGRIVSLEVGHGKVWAVEAGCHDVRGTCSIGGKVLSGPVGGTLTSVMDLPKGLSGSVVLHGSYVYVALARGDQASTTPTFAVSRDGSPSFTRLRLPCSDSQIPYLAAASDTRLSLVCQENEGAAGQQPKHYFTSLDAGAHWSPKLADPAQIVGTTVAATPTAAFVGNSRTGVEVTRDGGKTWTASLRSDAGCTYVGFVSSTVGEALVGDALELTHDAGRTWAVVRF